MQDSLGLVDKKKENFVLGGWLYLQRLIAWYSSNPVNWAVSRRHWRKCFQRSHYCLCKTCPTYTDILCNIITGFLLRPQRQIVWVIIGKPFLSVINYPISLSLDFRPTPVFWYYWSLPWQALRMSQSNVQLIQQGLILNPWPRRRRTQFKQGVVGV